MFFIFLLTGGPEMRKLVLDHALEEISHCFGCDGPRNHTWQLKPIQVRLRSGSDNIREFPTKMEKKRHQHGSVQLVSPFLRKTT